MFLLYKGWQHAIINLQSWYRSTSRVILYTKVVKVESWKNLCVWSCELNICRLDRLNVYSNKSMHISNKFKATVLKTKSNLTNLFCLFIGNQKSSSITMSSACLLLSMMAWVSPFMRICLAMIFYNHYICTPFPARVAIEHSRHHRTFRVCLVGFGLWVWGTNYLIL